jgi:hypothetical protein
MNIKLPRFPKTTLVLGAATVTLLWLPCPVHAQSSTPQASTPQDRPAVQSDNPTQNTSGQDRDADRTNVTNRDADRRDVANFDRFLDGHREIAEQVRKDPSLLDNRDFVRDHPALQTYLQDNPGVRDQLRQDPNAFMRQEDAYDRDTNMRDRDAGGQDRDADRRDIVNQDRDTNRRDVTNRDADRRDVANFDRFLDGHREIAEQVRKDPSLLDNRGFVQDHPALQTYLQDNPGVRDQLRQDPSAFMRQEDAYDRDTNTRDRDPMHDHMADFGGFLHSHSDIQKDVARDPSCVKDHEYVQKHAELDAYLNAHPDVRAELMANPQNFVRGAQQYGNASPNGTSSGAGVSGRATGTVGSGTGTTGSMTGTSTNPATTTHEPTKPNQ